MAGSHADACTQVDEGERVGDAAEDVDDPLVDGAWQRCVCTGLLDHFEGDGIGALGEFEVEGGNGGSGTVLDGESELAAVAEIAVAAQIKVGVAPGVELGGAAQGLTGAHAGGALLGVVNDDDGEAVMALQLAQEGEQRGDLA